MLEDAHQKRLRLCRRDRHPRAASPKRAQQRRDARIDARLKQPDLRIALAIDRHRAQRLVLTQAAQLLKARNQRRADEPPEHAVVRHGLPHLLERPARAAHDPLAALGDRSVKIEQYDVEFQVSSSSSGQKTPTL